MRFWRVEYNSMTLTLVDGARYEELRTMVARVPKHYHPITISTEEDVIHSPIASPSPTRRSPISSSQSHPVPSRSRASSSPILVRSPQSLRAAATSTDTRALVNEGTHRRRSTADSSYLLPPISMVRSRSLPNAEALVKELANGRSGECDGEGSAQSSPAAQELLRLMFSPVQGRKGPDCANGSPIMYEELVQQGYVFEHKDP